MPDTSSTPDHLTDAERAVLAEVYRWEHEHYPADLGPCTIEIDGVVRNASAEEQLEATTRTTDLLERADRLSVSPVPLYLLQCALGKRVKNVRAAALTLRKLGLVESKRGTLPVGRWQVGDGVLVAGTTNDDDAPVSGKAVAGQGWAQLEGPGENLATTGPPHGLTLTGDGLTLARRLFKHARKAPGKGGRPQDSDPKDDAKIAVAWEQWKNDPGNAYSYAAFGKSVHKPARTVRLAVDRHRKRGQRRVK